MGSSEPDLTAGLADEGLEGSSDALRSEWRERSLRSLYGGRDPDMWCEDTPSGLRFIAIDNSTYQITAEQLQFFKEHAEGEHPFVLLVHIPLYLEELQEALHGTEHASVRAVSLCGDERWGAETDKVSRRSSASSGPRTTPRRWNSSRRSSPAATSWPSWLAIYTRPRRRRLVERRWEHSNW